MAAISLIEWTQATLNPTLGCSKVGRECANCYAMAHVHRLAHNPNPAVAATYRGLVEKSAAGRLNWTGAVRTAPARLLEPFGWARHQLVFVNSLSDLFHEAVPDDFVRMTFRMMELCDWHVFQVLTKRDDRLADLAPRLPWPANVWMGVSVGEQAAAGRVDRLRAVPARVRFLSCEPLLEPLALDLTGIHWVITGGESGPHARPFDPAGALTLRDQCPAAGAAFFHKQNGGRNKKATGRLLDGREYDEMPAPTWGPVPPAAERKARRDRFRAESGRDPSGSLTAGGHGPRWWCCPARGRVVRPAAATEHASKPGRFRGHVAGGPPRAALRRNGGPPGRHLPIRRLTGPRGDGEAVRPGRPRRSRLAPRAAAGRRSDMNDGQYLLRAVIARPDDDTPRLVYADWLEEHGDPDRAGFIRLQCRLASEDVGEPEWWDLTKREKELLESRGADWAADVLGRGVHGVTFRRGFVESVSATAHAFASRGGSWCARTPLREAELTAAAGKVGRVAAASHTRSLSRLSLEDGGIGDEDLELLAASPHFPNLVDLSIRGPSGYGTRVGDRGLAALAGAAFFHGLIRLTVGGSTALGSAGIGALAAAGCPSRLQELFLSHTDIGDDGARAFAGADYPKLELLSIFVSRIGGEGLAALANPSGLTGLSRLYVQAGRVTGAQLPALALAGCRPGLRHISLYRNPLWAVDVAAVTDLLAADPGLSLDLQGCDVPRRVQEELTRLFDRRVWVDTPAREPRRPQIRGG